MLTLGGVSHDLTLFFDYFIFSPINDPLHLNKGDVNENIKLYREACKGKDWQSIKLTELAQRTQEDFYGRWVEEMTRIAKVRIVFIEFAYSQHAKSNSNLLFPA